MHNAKLIWILLVIIASWYGLHASYALFTQPPTPQEIQEDIDATNQKISQSCSRKAIASASGSTERKREIDRISIEAECLKTSLQPDYLFSWTLTAGTEAVPRQIDPNEISHGNISTNSWFHTGEIPDGWYKSPQKSNWGTDNETLKNGSRSQWILPIKKDGGNGAEGKGASWEVKPSLVVKEIANYYNGNPSKSECDGYKNDPKTVVIHYTATTPETTVSQIFSSHARRFWVEYYAWYHYLIKSDGEIVNVRPEECWALAEPKANQTAIHISYIGDDKPNSKQLESLTWLTGDIQKRYHLSRDAVTAHADIAAKNHKESMEYMFWSKEEFIKHIPSNSTELTCTIARKWWNDPRVQYAYDISSWNMDFIRTIEQESRWDIDAKWDHGKSFWLCQFHEIYNPERQKYYRSLKTDNEKVAYCYEYYLQVKKLPWWVWSRLHGWYNRNDDRNIKTFTVNCQ